MTTLITANNPAIVALGDIKYSLKPISCNITEVVNEPLSRERKQLIHTKSRDAMLVDIVDYEDDIQADVENDLFFYTETVLMEVEADNEDQAFTAAEMKINELNFNERYLMLEDFNKNCYLFAIIEVGINWKEAEELSI
ncbi:hypothetical protein [Bacillus seohaeanensis]|uniref:Uncharacterized protein n=1 Tax=Bacillus seohaeanensis TaxID=284580 RepID=A0ABW5RRE7_9BACI